MILVLCGYKSSITTNAFNSDPNFRGSHKLCIVSKRFRGVGAEARLCRFIIETTDILVYYNFNMVTTLKRITPVAVVTEHSYLVKAFFIYYVLITNT